MIPVTKTIDALYDFSSLTKSNGDRYHRLEQWYRLGSHAAEFPFQISSEFIVVNPMHLSYGWKEDGEHKISLRLLTFLLKNFPLHNL
jgi:hypothetical protein